jgi:hypothetical protein
MRCFGMMAWPVLKIRRAAGVAIQMRHAGNVLTAVMGDCCAARLV